ncbi:Dihydrodipicolinate synthase 2 [Pyrenophora tritici-repentis]|nr:Dihydrodipicolinate synthase 2 [Pyrenophora tritici-repentis]KAI0607826.1 Dihydrodipicolinate synthase 2 [Pyrenophora tritici-repentis]
MAPPPSAGVWCPAVTFYTPESDTATLDLVAQKQYFTYLSKSGLIGLVVLGSNAEAFLLTRDEKKALMKCAREAVGPDYPLMVGISGFSVPQVMENISDAIEAGANYGLLLPAAYYGPATSKDVIMAFYNEVAQKSSLPIVIYNFPGTCNGVDLDSVTIAALAKRNPGKIVGVKLTCGSVAKITRLCAELPSDTFSTFAGQADWMVAGLAVGSAGCVSAFSNVFPKVCSKVYELYTSGKTQEALELHRKAALAESPIKAGIAPTKHAVSQYSAKAAGIEGAEAKLNPRRPYSPVAEALKASVKDTMAELATIENSFANVEADQDVQMEDAPAPQSPAKPSSKAGKQAQDDFSAIYLRKVAAEFADDLDKVREAQDFKASSVPMLIHALKQGESLFSVEERRRVVGAANA